MIRIADLCFRYPQSTFELEVPELQIAKGERAALIGPSGVGKTTLVYLMAGILRPVRGAILVDGVDLARQSDAALRAFRIARIGFVFQEFELLDYLTVRENMLLPYYVNSTLKLTREAKEAGKALASSMGLEGLLGRRPRKLSHGERQRVAICRAMIASPRIIIADEPTGNLDPETAQSILALLLKEVEKRGATLLMVTHNHGLLDWFDRVINVQPFARKGAA
jgi:putative ABC transport system ATP-binding protein